jgi:hypothetical protein
MPNTYTSKDVVDGFLRFVLSRGVVRLDPRLYDRESYALDRNTIRRDTLAFSKAWKGICWRNEGDLAKALVEAGRCAFSGRLNFSASRGEWEYCAGQYQPTEIRRAAYHVVLTATTLLR